MADIETTATETTVEETTAVETEQATPTAKTFTQDELNAIANRLNERPRRILGYQTPREVFAKLLADEQMNASNT